MKWRMRNEMSGNGAYSRKKAGNVPKPPIRPSA